MKTIIHFDEPHIGPHGERCFIVEDGEGHRLSLIQPLSELGDGEAWEELARQWMSASKLKADNAALLEALEEITKVELPERNNFVWRGAAAKMKSIARAAIEQAKP